MLKKKISSKYILVSHYSANVVSTSFKFQFQFVLLWFLFWKTVLNIGRSEKKTSWRIKEKKIFLNPHAKDFSEDFTYLDTAMAF